MEISVWGSNCVRVLVVSWIFEFYYWFLKSFREFWFNVLRKRFDLECGFFCLVMNLGFLL